MTTVVKGAGVSGLGSGTRAIGVYEQTLAAGFIPQESVRSDTTFLVAADVDSLSVKARAARELGVPIVALEDFIRMLPPHLLPSSNERKAG